MFYAVQFSAQTIIEALFITGLPTTQMFSFAMGTLYKQFIEKDIDNFNDFHKAMLDAFK